MSRGRQKKYEKKPFESTGASSDTSANIYMSMLTSKAFAALTDKQKILYIYCKGQYYAEKGKEQRDHFTMNKSKWQKLYGLYNAGNEKGFYRDMNRLIEVGLIDCVSCGADARVKSIYRYSDRWQLYGTEAFNIPANVMTIAMTGTRKRKD